MIGLFWCTPRICRQVQLYEHTSMSPNKCLASAKMAIPFKAKCAPAPAHRGEEGSNMLHTQQFRAFALFDSSLGRATVHSDLSLICRFDVHMLHVTERSIFALNDKCRTAVQSVRASTCTRAFQHCAAQV